MSTSLPIQTRQIRGGPHWPGTADDGTDWTRIGARAFGEVVTDRASSWVRRLVTPGGNYYVKTYDYSTWRSRWSGALRHTGPFVRSRAAREFDALLWLGERTSPSAHPCAVFERRRLGLLVRAILVTLRGPGEPLDQLLPRIETAERPRIARALGRFVTRLHELGFRDGNLDLRNLLASRCDEGHWQFVKIDSPRFRLRRPGPVEDRWTLADWNRLLPQLAEFGVADAARPTNCR